MIWAGPAVRRGMLCVHIWTHRFERTRMQMPGPEGHPQRLDVGQGECSVSSQTPLCHFRAIKVCVCVSESTMVNHMCEYLCESG